MINKSTSKTIINFLCLYFLFFSSILLFYKYSELGLYFSVDLDFLNCSKIKGVVNSIYILILLLYRKIKSIYDF